MYDNDDHQHDADDRIGKTRSSSQPVSGGQGTSEPFRRMEILTGSQRRRTWPKDFKAKVIAETFEPGANVSAVARRRGVSIGLVHYWRKCARDGGLVGPGEAASFIPVVPDEAVSAPWGNRRREGSITIELRGAVVRLDGEVDDVNLGRVLSALRSGL